jgi:thiamine pyrophosphokinase
MPAARLGAWASKADLLLAADGGADRLLAAGVTPHHTIGDLDSLQAVGLPRLEMDPDQETSDCDKLLALAHRLGVEEITLACIEGDRLDHVLGTMSSALKSPVRVRLALRSGLAWVLRGDIRVRTKPGATVSLMPLMACANVSLRGVEWPLRNVPMSPFHQVSLSNRALGDVVEVDMGSGAAVLFVLGPDFETPSWGAVTPE